MLKTNKLTSSFANFFFLHTFNFGLLLLHKLSPTAHLTNWHYANVPTQQNALLTVWERSADTCMPYQVAILRIKPNFIYHDN
jgi:hypothetical protein